MSYIMTPADRYALAHELAHIKNEDHAMRVGAGAASAVFALGVGPLCGKLMAVNWRVGAMISMWSVVASFFSIKYFCRQQEYKADVAAGVGGYAKGGVIYWVKKCSLIAASSHYAKERQSEWKWWRSHPLAHERLRCMQTVMAETDVARPIA